MESIQWFIRKEYSAHQLVEMFKVFEMFEVFSGKHVDGSLGKCPFYNLRQVHACQWRGGTSVFF